MTEIDRLLDQPDGWRELLWRLLDFTRRFEQSFRAAEQAAPELVSDCLRELATEVHARLGAIPNASPTPGQIELLGELCRDHRKRFVDLPQEADVVLARATAFGLGESLEDTLDEALAARGELHIRPGTLYPVHSCDPRPYLASSANSRPQVDHSGPFDAVPNFRLADDRSSEYRVILDYDARNRLSALSRRSPIRIASVVPNATLEEFVISWPDSRDTRAESLQFRNHGPVDEQEQLSTLEALTRAAAQQSVDVLIMPEYSVPLNSRDGVVGLLDKLEERPALVVGGSAELQISDAATVNQGVLWMPHGGPRTFTKTHPAVFDEVREGITPGDREVRVLLSGDWAIAILICADGLRPALTRLLADVGVNLCIVIAMTPKTTSIVGNVGSLVTEAQAFVTLANNPAEWPDSPLARALASFDGPYAEGPTPLQVRTADLGDKPCPGLLLVDSRERTYRWLPLARATDADTVAEIVDTPDAHY